MRYSTDKNDTTGYANWERDHLTKDGKLNNIIIFLDDVEQHQVEMADDEEGIIIRCVLTDDGNFQMRPDNPDEIWRETVRGKVRIELRDQCSIS